MSTRTDTHSDRRAQTQVDRQRVWIHTDRYRQTDTEYYTHRHRVCIHTDIHSGRQTESMDTHRHTQTQIVIHTDIEYVYTHRHTQ